MKKHAANLITCVRIVLAPVLLSFTAVTKTYLILLTVCGLSDLLDGIVARATKTVSTLGSFLDTVGDVLLYSSAVKLFVLQQPKTFAFLWWMIAAMLMHLCASVIGKMRFQKMYFIHNAASKVWGVMMFLLPFAIFFRASEYWLMGICLAASCSAVDALLIQLFSKRPMPDARSFFSLRIAAE